MKREGDIRRTTAYRLGEALGDPAVEEALLIYILPLFLFFLSVVALLFGG